MSGVAPATESPPGEAPRCVVLLSGGLDSATVLAVARSRGYLPYALTLRYGQRHDEEVAAAGRVARSIGVARHALVDLDLRQFGGSALTSDLPVPKGEEDREIGGSIPVTYVPARNTIFLSLALGWAEALDARDLFLGVNALDYSGYPDCRPEFVEAFERLANLATRAGVEGERAFRVHAPLLHLGKGEIVRLGLELGVDFSLTRSCYDPVDGRACGACDACVLRRRGFAENGRSDPIEYAPGG